MTVPAEHLQRLLTRAIARAYPDVPSIPVSVESTKEVRHGDYTSSVAMQLAQTVHQPAADVAHHILAQLGPVPMLHRAEIVSPGFLNFFLEPKWLIGQVKKILADKKYGHNNSGKNQRLVVEFVSANPTGPITFGNGRAAFRGDALSHVLVMNGWRVVREYYINDWGNQANILAESVLRRYWQQHGIPTEYPEYCYPGEYVAELAKKVKIEKLRLASMPILRDTIKGRILEFMIKDHERVMKKVGVRYDSWLRESKLHVRKTDQKVLSILDSHNLLYQAEDATWFRSTAFGDDKDRVVIKKDGTMTYIVADLALRWNRFAERKFDRELLFLGADHHGYIKRLEAAAAALGFARRVTVIIHQLVRLIKGGQEVKMSKRAGTYVTLEEVVDDVGPDATKFFFIMHNASTHMDFNIDLAKEQSEKNPVYYVQYAHARISSILKKLKGLPMATKKQPLHASELQLTKALLQFPAVIREVGQNYETHMLAHYATQLATHFHDFYTNCRVIDHETVVTYRLTLIKATQMILQKTLGLMGVSAPEKM